MANTEHQQAAYMARAALIMFAEDIKAVMPYCMGQPEKNPAEKEHFFGFVRRDLTPKLVLAAYAAAARLLEGSDYLGDLDIGSDIGAMLFRLPDGRRMAALYTDGPEQRILFRPDCDRLTRTDIVGNSEELEVRNGKLPLTLTEDPVYLIGLGPAVEGKLTRDGGKWSGVIRRGKRECRFAADPAAAFDAPGVQWHEMNATGIDKSKFLVRWAAAWNRQFLLLDFRITDDEPGWNPGDGADVWKGDAIELFISARPDRVVPGFLKEFDYQLLFTPFAKNSRKEVAVYGMCGDNSLRGKPIPGVKAVYRVEKDGWSARLAIPFAALGLPDGPQDKIGLEIAVDNRGKEQPRFQVNSNDCSVRPRHQNQPLRHRHAGRRRTAGRHRLVRRQRHDPAERLHHLVEGRPDFRPYQTPDAHQLQSGPGDQQTGGRRRTVFPDDHPERQHLSGLQHREGEDRDLPDSGGGAEMKLCVAFLFCFAALLLPGGELPNREALFALPGWTPAPGFEPNGNENIRGIFYDGLPYRGKPTRVFAWYGTPAKTEGKCPAIILVHGGGGTAFRYWARLWVERGYAVLAMDTTGGVPRNNGESGSDNSVHHPEGGPGLGRVFRDTGLPPQEQWPYHAIGAVIRANTLLRSFPEIDPERIGVTGISWGAVVGETAVSLDSRFKFAAMVYGCGFLGRNSSWKETEFAKMPPELVERWVRLWDPSSYLAGDKVPILFCNGVSDRHFRPDSWWSTCRLVKPELRHTALRVGMGHAHPPSGDQPEVAAFADAAVRGGKPLPRIVSQTPESVVYDAPIPLKRAELNCTEDTGDWTRRRWKIVPARIDREKRTVTAEIPPAATAWYFNIIDERGCIASGEIEEKK